MDAEEIEAGFLLYRSMYNDERIMEQQNQKLLEKASGVDPRQTSHKINVEHLLPIVEDDMTNGWLPLSWNELQPTQRKELLQATARYKYPGLPVNSANVNSENFFFFLFQFLQTIFI